MIFDEKGKMIAIIPARGGSKRIPRKNVKDFCGRPILSYSIDAANDSGLFDEVMVSTDDKEVAEIAETYGANVPFFRSAENSSDYATTTDVLLEVIREYQKQGNNFTWLCCLYPTAPFVTGEKLKRAFTQLSESNMDALMPVVSFSYPPLRGLVIQENQVSIKWPEYTFTRSQDLETIYHDCGQFYFIRTDVIIREKNMICRKMMPMIMSEVEVQDIDNEIDWELAELKYSLLKRKGLI